MALTPKESVFPDELMIDWGDVPLGSTASIYWPQLQASDVITLSTALYGCHALSAADANTLQCRTVKGATYIPILPGGDGNTNIAGLFTVDLPATVVKGQEFNVVVRRLRARTLGRPVVPPPPPPPVPRIAAKQRSRKFAIRAVPATRNAPLYGREVMGSFNFRTPVSTADQLLRPEADTLAIMKAPLDATATTSRWHQVLVRYIGYLSGRVDGLGGSASSIPPSFGGAPIPLPEPGHGKVSGICYDGAGLFEGFLLEAESCETGRRRHPQVRNKSHHDWSDDDVELVCGKGETPHEHHFSSTKEKIYELVEKAWCQGTPVSVCVLMDKPHVITTVVLREPLETEHRH